MRVDVPALLTRLGIKAQLRGREWTALCPNPEHDDKHPSWRMREEPGSKKHGAHKCHACGLGGGPDELVMAVLGMEREDARTWLQGAAMAEPPMAESVELVVGRLSSKMQLPPGVITGRTLDKWSASARAYAERRGLTAAQVERWQIGYAVDGRLGGRIVIPKQDSDGVLRGYSARSFIGDPKKYLEASPKEGGSAWVVFGERYWPDERWSSTLVVAEGALNALALERAGYGYVAATSGSTLHPMVAAKLASFARVIAVTDPDDAGDKLAATIEQMIARHSTKFYRLRLPSGRDAQDLGDQGLRDYLSDHDL